MSEAGDVKHKQEGRGMCKFLTWVCCRMIMKILICVMTISRKQWELDVIKQLMFLQDNKISSRTNHPLPVPVYLSGPAVGEDIE